MEELIWLHSALALVEYEHRVHVLTCSCDGHQDARYYKRYVEKTFLPQLKQFTSVTTQLQVDLATLSTRASRIQGCCSASFQRLELYCKEVSDFVACVCICVSLLVNGDDLGSYDQVLIGRL
jgi:hypothetical protein